VRPSGILEQIGGFQEASSRVHVARNFLDGSIHEQRVVAGIRIGRQVPVYADCHVDPVEALLPFRQDAGTAGTYLKDKSISEPPVLTFGNEFDGGASDAVQG
jgi:hypothetical protein